MHGSIKNGLKLGGKIMKSVGSIDATDDFLETLKIQRVIEELRRADIKTVYAKNKSRSSFQLEWSTKLSETFELRPESLALPHPDAYIRVSRSTVEKAAYMNVKDVPVKKITFELDILTGRTTLLFID